MRKIAHRGYKTNSIRENTLEAFTNAVNNGFDGIECDVRKSRDGILVISHDASIERTSNGYGFVRDMNYKELEKYNFGSDTVPSKIPTLIDVLKKYRGIYKLIELKCEVDLESVRDVVDDKTYFMSFDNGLVRRLKKKYPNFKFGVLNYVLNSEYNYDLDMICILDAVANDEIVMNFLKKGTKVFIYGIVGKINYVRDFEGLFYIVEHKN